MWHIKNKFFKSFFVDGVAAQYKNKVLIQPRQCQEQQRTFHVAASLQSKDGSGDDGTGGEGGASGQGPSSSGGEEKRVRPCSNCGEALQIDSKGKSVRYMNAQTASNWSLFNMNFIDFMLIASIKTNV